MDSNVGLPQMESRWIKLRPVHPPDYRYLFELAVDPTSSYRWRFRVSVPTYEDFVRTVGQGVLVQFPRRIVHDGAPPRLGRVLRG